MRAKNNWVWWEWLGVGLLVFGLLYCLMGCGTMSHRETKTVERGHVLGSYAGQQIDVAYERFLESGEDVKTDFKVPELGAVAKVAGAVATGDIVALVTAIGSVLGAGGIAIAKHGEAKRAKRSEDEMYEDFKDLHRQTRRTERLDEP